MIEVLNKAGITIKGKITRTALLLLGNSLKKRGLAEGRYPNIFDSFKVADIVGQKLKKGI